MRRFLVNCWYKHCKHSWHSISFHHRPPPWQRGKPNHVIQSIKHRFRSRRNHPPIYKTNGAQGWCVHGPLHHHLTTAPPNNACIPNEPTNPRSMWTRTTFSSEKKKNPSGPPPPTDRLNPLFLPCTVVTAVVCQHFFLTPFDISLPRLLPLLLFSTVDTHTNGQWIWNTGKNREVLFLLDRFFNMHGPCRGPCPMPSEKGRLF